jgi:hypothetical protein
MGSINRFENTTTLFARKREFGFLCPAFSIGLSGDGFLLPRSENELLRRTLLAAKVLTGDLTGRYTLEIHHDGTEFCKVAVIVAWANHRSEWGAFLAIKVREPRRLRRSLRQLSGKDVELALRPRLAPHLRRPINLR